MQQNQWTRNVLKRRHEIMDEQFAKIKNLLPAREEFAGVTAKDHRLFVNAVIWIFKTSSPWRDFPAIFRLKYKFTRNR